MQEALKQLAEQMGKTRTGPLGGEVLAIEAGAINMYREENRPLREDRSERKGRDDSGSD